SVSAADGLEQVVVAQLVIQIDVGAGGRIKAGEQFTHHDQQFQVGRFILKAAFHFVFVLFGALEALQYIVGIGVVLEALVAVRRFAGDGVMVRLEGRDDAAVFAKRGV